jgi:hypothetical protein
VWVAGARPIEGGRREETSGKGAKGGSRRGQGEVQGVEQVRDPFLKVIAAGDEKNWLNPYQNGQGWK